MYEEYYGVNDYRNYIQHYGVKGMKWRKRKAKNRFVQGINSFVDTYITGETYKNKMEEARRRQAGEYSRFSVKQNTTDYSRYHRKSRNVDKSMAKKYEEKYSKTLYGRIDKAKAAVKSIINKYNKKKG